MKHEHVTAKVGPRQPPNVWRDVEPPHNFTNDAGVEMVEVHADQMADLAWRQRASTSVRGNTETQFTLIVRENGETSQICELGHKKDICKCHQVGRCNLKPVLKAPGFRLVSALETKI